MTIGSRAPHASEVAGVARASSRMVRYDCVDEGDAARSHSGSQGHATGKGEEARQRPGVTVRPDPGNLLARLIT